MCEYEMGELIEVSNYNTKLLKRIFIKRGRGNSVICVMDGFESAYENGECFETCIWRYHRKLQLITDEVRAKLKQAIDDKKELKFRIESEEQSKELQEFLVDIGYIYCGRAKSGYIERFNKARFLYIDKELLLSLGNLEDSFNKDEYIEFNLKTGEIVEPEKELVDYEISWSGSKAKIDLIDGAHGLCIINKYHIGESIGDYLLAGYEYSNGMIKNYPIMFNSNSTEIEAKAVYARFVKVK